MNPLPIGGVTAIDRFGLRRRWASVVTLIACSLAFCGRSYGGIPDLVSLRVQAHFHASLLRRVQFAYHYESDTGLISDVKLVAAGERFRCDRVDTAGAVVQGRTTPPFTTSVAYNGRRQQMLDGYRSILRLEDGCDGASYGIESPVILPYHWLASPGAPALRWDMIVSNELWEKRFTDANYIGEVKEDGRALMAVEFPQRDGVTTPCIWQVLFARDVGYLPIRYVRRVEKTGEASSTMQVKQFRMFSIDGQQVAVPTTVTFQESGADKVSLRQSFTLTVDEHSLKVNEDVHVDDALFTLTTAGVKTIRDVNDFERKVAAAEGRNRRGLDTDSGAEASGRARVLWASAISLVLFAAFLLVCWQRQRLGRQ